MKFVYKTRDSKACTKKIFFDFAIEPNKHSRPFSRYGLLVVYKFL